jgi:hypothetical protein
MSKLERFKYSGDTYFYHVEQPALYLYDKKDVVHVLIYECVDYGGNRYIVEWRIPGTRDRDIVYAKRMSLKLTPCKLNRR